MSSRKPKRPSAAGGESGKKKVKIESVDSLNEKFPNVGMFKTLMQLGNPISSVNQFIACHFALNLNTRVY